MPKPGVTEGEIEAAEALSSRREFHAALSLLKSMLAHAEDKQTRMRLLFDIVTCSTWLNRKQDLMEAVGELKQLPAYDVSQIFINKTQARACIDSERVEEALDLIEKNLGAELLQNAAFRDWKYEHLFLKGHSLVHLARCNEALSVFDSAHDLYPDGEFETDILIDRANCLLAVKRYDEAYDAASRVLSRDDGEKATLAMQYMARCRMWQTRVPEALELYVAITKRLPCTLVQEEEIQTAIKNAMMHLKMGSSRRKPS